MSISLSHAEMCLLFGVKGATLAAWRREGMPVMIIGGPGAPAVYDGEACVAWMLERERKALLKKYEKHDGTKPLNAALEKARESKERADKYALDNAVRRGEVVEIADIEQDWVTKILACKSRLLSIPTKAAPLVVATTNMRETQQVLESLVDDALQELEANEA